MKKLFLFLFMLFACPALAANYTIILDDGSTIECDSYREESGNIYYEGTYDVESMVSKSAIVEIVDNLKEASIDNFVEKLREGDENAIKELFEYAAVSFLEHVDEIEGETTHGYYDTACTYKLFVNTEMAKYSVDKTDSLLSPYEATISCDCDYRLYYLGTDTIVDRYDFYEENRATLVFHYDEDSLLWKFHRGADDWEMVEVFIKEINVFYNIQNELIIRGSQ
jgi:hypothetical protein